MGLVDSREGSFGEDLQEIGTDYMENRGGEAGGGMGVARLRRARSPEWSLIRC